MYQALRLHFSSEQYDYIKYNGKTRYTEAGFNRRKDKYFYQKLANHKDPKKFVLANIIDGDLTKYIGDIVKDSEAEKIYQNWLKRQESISYIIGNEISQLSGDEEFFNECFEVKNKQHPILLKWFMEGKFCYESMIILDDIFYFFPIWNDKIEEHIIWPKIEMKCRKYKPFLSYNKNKMKNIIREKIIS